MGQHQWTDLVQPSKVNGAAVTAMTDSHHQHGGSAGAHRLRQLLHRQRQQLVLPAHPTSKEPPRRRQRQAAHRLLKQHRHLKQHRQGASEGREARTAGAVAVASERGGPLMILTSRPATRVRCRKVLIIVELRRRALLLTQT